MKYQLEVEKGKSKSFEQEWEIKEAGFLRQV